MHGGSGRLLLAWGSGYPEAAGTGLIWPSLMLAARLVMTDLEKYRIHP